MAYKIIKEECTACGACMDECPVEAITAGDEYYTIDEELCTECGACFDVCSADAIVLDESISQMQIS
jgi:ferredoxin